jgi:pSer/pThr/pTyr-binding forkhead associated (FHA) protein
VYQHAHGTAKGAAAWLVRHTENMQTLSFELREGANVLGRNPTGPGNHILIDNDKYVSRMHARIDMIPSFEGYRFELTDGLQSFAMKPSLNGTYRNGEHTRIQPEKKVILMDGDTIQIGETKFCLKVAPVSKKRNVEEEVASSDYVKTVVIKLQ